MSVNLVSGWQLIRTDGDQLQANSDPNFAAHPAPVVSVAITTFNSSKWLSRALDSVFAQKTTFPVEVVIGDDCSSDSTVSIAHSYAERYPGTIRVLERAQNVGMCRNYYETFEQCRGEFIVWLDADDYWTDPEKLTTQVAVLREDSSINVCGHFVRWVTDEGEVAREKYPSISSGRYGIGEIIRHNFLPSCSVMFRNGIQRDLPDWYFDIAPTTDHPLWVVASLSGDIVLLERTMADYMLTPGSSYMSKGPLFWYQQNAKFLEHIEKIVPPQWQRTVRREKGKRFESMAYLLRQNGDFVASRNAAIRAFRSPHLIDNFASKSKALLAAVVREMEWRVRGDRVLQNSD